MKDFILKMQEEKRKMSKNEKLQGKYDRFRCFFIYQNEKNYDKIRRMMLENAKKLACEVRKTNYRSEGNNKKSRHNNGR